MSAGGHSTILNLYTSENGLYFSNKFDCKLNKKISYEENNALQKKKLGKTYYNIQKYLILCDVIMELL